MMKTPLTNTIANSTVTSPLCSTFDSEQVSISDIILVTNNTRSTMSSPSASVASSSVASAGTVSSASDAGGTTAPGGSTVPSSTVVAANVPPTIAELVSDEEEGKEESPQEKTLRENFNRLAFGEGSKGKDKTVQMDEEKMNYLIGLMEKWNQPNLAKRRKFRKENYKNGPNYGKVYEVKTVILPNGTPEKQLHRIPKTGAKKNIGRGTLCIPISRTFDLLKSLHSRNNHFKSNPLHQEVKKTVINVTKDMCRIFVRLCAVCNTQNPKIKALRGADNPIDSDRYRDRFQVDLIDMRSKPAKNP